MIEFILTRLLYIVLQIVLYLLLVDLKMSLLNSQFDDFKKKLAFDYSTFWKNIILLNVFNKGFFAGGHGYQFIAETYIVFALYIL